jgi:hypothetical protein
MIREIHWHQVVVSVVVYFLLMLATDVWAIFFSKGIEEDEKKANLDYLCPKLTDVNFARTIPTATMAKCPNVERIRVQMILKPDE